MIKSLKEATQRPLFQATLLDILQEQKKIDPLISFKKNNLHECIVHEGNVNCLKRTNFKSEALFGY